MNVFKKENFIRTMGEDLYKFISSNENFNWVDRLDGKEVINGYVELYGENFKIHKNWCEKVV